jgi:glutamate-1-semialdehyde 2,1-aminomutase
VATASGRELRDVDGHRYVDLLGNYTAGLLGHDPGPVLDAARSALDSGWALGSVHENEVRLAELLVGRFESIEQIRFTNSGTEANLMALAVATHHTGRRTIVVFAHGYHGGVITFGAGPSPVNVPHDWLVCRYNDIDDVATAFDAHGSDIAAVLVEPMQGSGGCVAGDPDFLESLRSLCDEHGSLLVFDEVMTSRFSRSGAQGLLGIRPDLTTLGKYLAGGFTFGAFGGRAEVMAHFDPAAGGVLGHAGTFNNNVVSMAAGVATLTEMLTDDVLDATHARGERLRAALNDSFERNRLAMCATGIGSLMNVHGTSGPVRCVDDLAASDDRLKELLFFHCLDNGYYMARRGFIALSIEITDADIADFVDVVDGFRPVAVSTTPG